LADIFLTKVHAKHNLRIVADGGGVRALMLLSHPFARLSDAFRDCRGGSNPKVLGLEMEELATGAERMTKGTRI